MASVKFILNWGALVVMMVGYWGVVKQRRVPSYLCGKVSPKLFLHRSVRPEDAI